MEKKKKTKVKDLYNKTFKTLIKTMKKLTEDGNASHAHGLVGLIL
jgi:BRCT domain type II-containing protein